MLSLDNLTWQDADWWKADVQSHMNAKVGVGSVIRQREIRSSMWCIIRSGLQSLNGPMIWANVELQPEQQRDGCLEIPVLAFLPIRC